VQAAIAVGAVAAAVLLLAARRNPGRRGWALVAIAGAILYFALRELPLAFVERQPGVHWNWSGHVLAIGGMLMLGAALAGRLGLGSRDFGFAWPKHLGLASAVCAAAIFASYALHGASGGRLERIPAATWLFVAIMPGLAEEVAFRGVLLAAADRAAPASVRLAGVQVSLGAAVLTAAFVGLHGFGLGMLVSVLPGALLYLWLRLKTGSVLVPIVAHNLWNLTVLAAHYNRPQ
jgi:membrane protease YdiL (CAAX protease family)